MISVVTVALGVFLGHFMFLLAFAVGQEVYWRQP